MYHGQSGLTFAKNATYLLKVNSRCNCYFSMLSPMHRRFLCKALDYRMSLDHLMKLFWISKGFSKLVGHTDYLYLIRYDLTRRDRSSNYGLPIDNGIIFLSGFGLMSIFSTILRITLTEFIARLDGLMLQLFLTFILNVNNSNCFCC